MDYIPMMELAAKAMIDRADPDDTNTALREADEFFAGMGYLEFERWKYEMGRGGKIEYAPEGQFILITVEEQEELQSEE